MNIELWQLKKIFYVYCKVEFDDRGEDRDYVECRLFLYRAISVRHSAQRSLSFCSPPSLVVPVRFSICAGLENSRVPISPQCHSRRRVFPMSTFKIETGKSRRYQAYLVYMTNVGAGMWTLSFGETHRDGYDGSLTKASLTSRGGIRDWCFCVATTADTGYALFNCVL